MIDHALLLMSAGAAGYRIISSGLDRASRFKERTLDEVFDFVHPLDNQDAATLFDPQEEEQAARFWQTRELYREEQRRRLARAQSYILRRRHNALIVEQWANTEWSDMRRYHLEDEAGPDLIEAILAVQKAAAEFRVACTLVLARIGLWNVLLLADKSRLLPLPSVAGLRTTGKVDLLLGYQAVKESALALARFYGEERYQRLQALM
ncbi:MAG TPA: hypothetical protein VNV88_08940 [Candidatus Solibacter sp.]|jgi:hypothetical protein|nr:hypothetical protein [Candidatus Solibacter sp.]